MRFLFICTGAGEYSILKSFANYVEEQGDNVIFLAPDTILDIVKAEKPKFDIEIYDSRNRDVLGQLKILSDMYRIDILVMKPSRGALIHLKRPESIKVAVTVEDNLQFMGVGASYRLQTVMPKWLDIYAVNWHPEMYRRALYHHYGTEDVSAYPDIADKVRAVGWIPSVGYETVENANYTFSYFGSGSNFNEGILPKFVEAYKDLHGDSRHLAVSRDVVTGDYPWLDIAPKVEDYGTLITNAKAAFLHEGYGSICKCISNQVPVFSVCGPSQIKQMEIQPAEDLGLLYKFDRPAMSLDIDTKELAQAIEEFMDTKDKIAANQKKYAMSGEKNLYKLIQEKYEESI